MGVWSRLEGNAVRVEIVGPTIDVIRLPDEQAEMVEPTLRDRTIGTGQHLGDGSLVATEFIKRLASLGVPGSYDAIFGGRDEICPRSFKCHRKHRLFQRDRRQPYHVRNRHGRGACPAKHRANVG